MTAGVRRNLLITASAAVPQRFGERIRKDYDRWVKVAREQNIKPE